MLNILMLLLGFEVNLGYNIKFYVPSLNKRDMLQMQIARVEDKLNRELKREGTVKIGNAVYKLQEKRYDNNIELLQLRMVSYIVKPDSIEALVEVIPLASNAFLQLPRNKIVRVEVGR